MHINSLISSMSIQSPTGSIPFRPSLVQQQILNAQLHHKNVIVNHTRQAGATTIMLMHMLGRCILNPGSSGAILSKNIWNSMSTLLDIIQESKLDSQLNYTSKQALTFKNGSQITTFTSPHYVRGMTITDAILDNFNIFSNQEQEDLIGTLWPAILDTDSKLMISTFGSYNRDSWIFKTMENYRNSQTPEDMFVNRLKGLKAPFYVVEISNSNIPGRDLAWEETQESLMGVDNFNKEYKLPWQTKI